MFMFINNTIATKMVHCSWAISIDIVLVACTGQYKIYCPTKAFDLPTQSVTYIIMYIDIANSIGKSPNLEE